MANLFPSKMFQPEGLPYRERGRFQRREQSATISAYGVHSPEGLVCARYRSRQALPGLDGNNSRAQPRVAAMESPRPFGPEWAQGQALRANAYTDFLRGLDDVSLSALTDGLRATAARGEEDEDGGRIRAG